MKPILKIMALTVVLLPGVGHGQPSAPDGGRPTKTTFVQLANNAYAVIVEPVTPDPMKSRIAVFITHPTLVNTLNYFIGRELAQRGYRVMMMNVTGADPGLLTYDEVSYEMYIPPIAAAIKALRAIPGVQKVVLAGHSTGGPELTAYQDVAENGVKACQGPERIAKCSGKGLENLPQADGVMLLDIATGAPERTIALNPAVGAHSPHRERPDLDSFDPVNGYDPATRSATYSAEFLKQYFAAQRERANQLIDEALAREASIQKGESDYKDDEPFVVTGSDTHATGARLDLADTRLLSKTHAPHLFLKADGSTPVQIIPLVQPPLGTPQDQGQLYRTVMESTVKYYLSFQAVRLNPDYALTENNVVGVQWRSTPNSAEGNVEGIRVPTLVMAATCAVHLVFSEITYDHSAAKDKQFVGVEGANHQFQPCRPQFGDTSKRTFDFVDRWLSSPGRF
jgi:pimeloyl-ACP methyl ester carboxylesterase